MAKALIGHVGLGPDLAMAAELRRLRLRVKELETELADVRAANRALAEAVTIADHLHAEPALA